MKKRLSASANLSVGLVLGATLLPLPATAGICSDVEQLERFSESDRVESQYFDEYYIRRIRGVYFILAVKKLPLDFVGARDVLGNLARHAEFLPGYKKIQVSTRDDGAIYTAIRFRPAFSFFESRFTNEVEQVATKMQFRQCWRLLGENDPRVMETYTFAPEVNRGYWRLTRLAQESAELRYFSSIKPPLPIPKFIYQEVVASNYQEVFEALIARIRSR